jgi:hypothetical protein
MTVLLEKDVDVEKIKEDLARLQAEKEAAAAAKKERDEKLAAPAEETVADESSNETVEPDPEVKPEAETVETTAAETEATEATKEAS